MNVILINSFHLAGGASVAGARLHRALNTYGSQNGTLQSKLLVGIPKWLDTYRDEPGLYSLADNFFRDKVALARLVTERYFFVFHARDKTVYSRFSVNIIGADLVKHPLILEADVIHLHWVHLGVLSIEGIEALFSLNKPIIWTLHDMWAFTGGCHYADTCTKFVHHCSHCPMLRKPGPDDLSYKVFERKLHLLNKARETGLLHIVTPSKWLGDEAQKSFLLQGIPISVIPNPIDTHVFKPMQREASNRLLGLPATGAVRLLFGSKSIEEPRKGFQYFVQSLHLFKRKYPTVQLEVLLFGKGTPTANIPYPVHNLGVIASEERIVAVYNAADAMVAPSLEDNLPNTVVEAMACGTPVIAFNNGGLPNMVVHKHNGFLAASTSATELSEGIKWLLETADKEIIRQNARSFALSHYSELIVAKQYQAVYTALFERVRKVKDFSK